MDRAEVRERVGQWALRESRLGGSTQDDASTLADYIAAGEALLALLPAQAGRSLDEHELAQDVLSASRRVRGRFIHFHPEAVYDALTADRTEPRRLSELVFAAAERFPGLVPTRDQMRVEDECIPLDKCGREIDQGIFFRGLLRSPVVGVHLIEAMLLPSPRAQRLIGQFHRDGSVDLGSVVVERRGCAAFLTVQNQRCLNAEDNGLVDDMETAVDLALLDDQVRVGVLRGGTMTHPRYLGRRVFNAGINLLDLRDGRISFVEFILRREFTYINKIARGLLTHHGQDASPTQTVQKPWVAAVDSFAIGGGMQLLLVFDRVIAADDAYFVLPAAREGLVPGAANLRLHRFTGGRMARRMVLSGQRIRAADPDSRLVCDEVVSVGEMDSAIERAIVELDSQGVLANRRLLASAEEPIDDFRTYMAEFALTQAMRLHARDVIDRAAGFHSSRALAR
jgi:thioesterase DpgC